MHIKLVEQFENDSNYNKRVDYWKTVLKTLRFEFVSKDHNSEIPLKDRKFRKWLLSNWGIKLTFRSRNTRGWIERIKYGAVKVSYVHALEIPKDYLSLLLIKFPTDLLIEDTVDES